MNTNQPAETVFSEFCFDEETHHKFVHLMCFLRQLNCLHSTNDIDDAVDIDIEDDSESISSLKVLQETETPTDTEVGLLQILVDAISFVASVERTAAHVVAIAAEEMDEPKGIRFRVSANGEIQESMLSELKELGVLLGQLTAEGITITVSPSKLQVADLVSRSR